VICVSGAQFHRRRDQVRHFTGRHIHVAPICIPCSINKVVVFMTLYILSHVCIPHFVDTFYCLPLLRFYSRQFFKFLDVYLQRSLIERRLLRHTDMFCPNNHCLKYLSLAFMPIIGRFLDPLLLKPLEFWAS